MLIAFIQNIILTFLYMYLNKKTDLSAIHFQHIFVFDDDDGVFSLYHFEIIFIAISIVSPERKV